MLFTTPTQYAVLALLFVAGWRFGLASHPGGAKWKTRYATERDAHAATRREADARAAEHRTGVDERYSTAQARIAELERENDRLAKAAPVTASTIGSHDRVATPAPSVPLGSRVVIAPGGRPAGASRGWFDWR